MSTPNAISFRGSVQGRKGNFSGAAGDLSQCLLIVKEKLQNKN
jgi:hypothetical protein